MRFFFAIASLALAAVFLLLGIGQRTFLAGPSEIVYPVERVGSSPYAVIPGSVFSAVDGQANVVVSGDTAFAAVGSSIDVAAWVRAFDHETIDIDGKQLVSVPIAGESEDAANEDAAAADAAAEDTSAESTDAAAEDAASSTATGPDPRGSDLWLEERSTNPGAEADGDSAESDAAENGQTGAQTLRLAVDPTEQQSVLIAADGEQVLPQEISIAWVQDRNTPLAGPFLVAGGVFALLGGILYLLAVDHDRRGLGPRRGRKGPFQGIRNSFDRSKSKRAVGETTGSGGKMSRRARRMAIPVIGLSLTLGLSACSPSYWPTAEPVETSAAPETTEAPSAPVPVTEGQLATILERIAMVATEGDDAQDSSILEERFVGAALEQRAANYKIRTEVPDYDVVPPTLTGEGLDYQLVQSTEGWPRTIFATVASAPAEDAAAAEEGNAAETPDPTESPAPPESTPSLALVMSQAGPHENYQVSHVITLRGGISMPAAAPASEGTAVLADDLQSLVLEPREVGDAYAQILAEGPDAEPAELFDIADDALLEKSGRAWVAQAQEAADAEDQTVNYSVSVAQSDDPIVSLSTGVDGALVTTTIIEERTEAAGDGNWKPTAVGSVTALSGLEGRQEKLVREVAHQMLFFVPGKDTGEKIQVLGVTSELVGARK